MAGSIGWRFGRASAVAGSVGSVAAVGSVVSVGVLHSTGTPRAALTVGSDRLSEPGGGLRRDGDGRPRAWGATPNADDRSGSGHPVGWYANAVSSARAGTTNPLTARAPISRECPPVVTSWEH